jgi:shikimate kinase
MNNIFLIGSRGTGKSAIAPLLARHLGRPWEDTDQLVMNLLGKSVADVFRDDGEDYFREQETKVLQEVVQQGPSVVATGGGIILREENRRRLRESGWVVWLRAEPEVILRRLRDDPSTASLRPPLTHLTHLAEIELLIRQRDPLYQITAHFTLDTDHLSPQDSVEAIVRNMPRTGQHGLV